AAQHQAAAVDRRARWRCHAAVPAAQRAAARYRARAARLAAEAGAVHQGKRRAAMIPAARRRLVMLDAVVVALLVALGGRLWYLQVMTVGSYASAATQDQVRSVIVPPVRGQILDDAGHPLVDNHTSLVVSVNRQLVSQQADGGI